GTQHAAKRLHRDLALAVQDFHEARHVRALEVVRQAHVHVETGDGVLLTRGSILDPHRVADVLDAHAVDGQLARVAARLHVLDLGDGGARELGGGERRSHERKPTGNNRMIALLGTRQGRGIPLFGYGATGRGPRAQPLLVAGTGPRRHTPPAERRRSGACSAHQRSMLAPRPAASSPAARRQPSREPCSMKRSGMPSCSTGSCRASAASTSRTAEPAPPCVAFSSLVTSARWRAASDTTRSDRKSVV